MPDTVYDAPFMEYVSSSSAYSARKITNKLKPLLGIGSVLDVGCATGTWLRAWQSAGVETIQGVDGDYVDRTMLAIPGDRFQPHDLRTPFSLNAQYDLVQCLEVAEHLPTESSETFVRTLTSHSRRFVMFSAAPPGQGGESHINEQTYEFWRKLFGKNGFRPYDLVRPMIANDAGISFWYRYNIILFVRDTEEAGLAPEVRSSRIADSEAIADISPAFFKLRKAIIRTFPVALQDYLARVKARYFAMRARNNRGMQVPDGSRRGDYSQSTFAEKQYALTYAPGVENHFWHIARNRIIRRHLIRALEAQGAGGGMVLDVGCGPGIAVNFMRESGIDCYGVELGSPEVRPGMEAYVRTGTDATQLPEDMRARVRVITLLDVLEHIENPVDFLQSLLAAFPNAGAVLVAVPARPELWSNYDEFFGHHLRYDFGAMRQVATDAGLEPQLLKYFFNALYPVMYAMTWRSKERSLETPPQSGMLGRIAHAVLGGAFLVEERLPFMGVVPGTSLLAVLNRKR